MRIYIYVYIGIFPHTTNTGGISIEGTVVFCSGLIYCWLDLWLCRETSSVHTNFSSGSWKIPQIVDQQNLVLNSLLGGGLKHFLFSPLFGEDSNLTNFFQMGWNHHLVCVWNFCIASNHPQLFDQIPSRIPNHDPSTWICLFKVTFLRILPWDSSPFRRILRLSLFPGIFHKQIQDTLPGTICFPSHGIHHHFWETIFGNGTFSKHQITVANPRFHHVIMWLDFWTFFFQKGNKTW